MATKRDGSVIFTQVRYPDFATNRSLAEAVPGQPRLLRQPVCGRFAWIRDRASCCRRSRVPHR